MVSLTFCTICILTWKRLSAFASVLRRKKVLARQALWIYVTVRVLFAIRTNSNKYDYILNSSSLNPYYFRNDNNEYTICYIRSPPARAEPKLVELPVSIPMSQEDSYTKRLLHLLYSLTLSSDNACFISSLTRHINSSIFRFHPKLNINYRQFPFKTIVHKLDHHYPHPLIENSTI